MRKWECVHLCKSGVEWIIIFSFLNYYNFTEEWECVHLCKSGVEWIYILLFFLLLLLLFYWAFTSQYCAKLLFAESLSLCDYASVPWGFNDAPKPIPLFLCLYYYLWEVVLATKPAFYFYFSLSLYKPILCWVSIYAESLSLCDYFNDIYIEQSLNLYFYVYIIIRGR